MTKRDDDLDAEIAKYGGQALPGGDLLAVLPAEDRIAVAAFAKVLGARVDAVIPKGARDPGMPSNSVSWAEWERRRNRRIFREGQLASDQARAEKEHEEARRRREEAERQQEKRQHRSELPAKSKKPPEPEDFGDVWS